MQLHSLNVSARQSDQPMEKLERAPLAMYMQSKISPSTVTAAIFTHVSDF